MKFYCSATQTPSVGEVCEDPEVSSFHFNPYLVLEFLLVHASCSINKIQNKKNMRGVAMVTILSSHLQNSMISTLSVLLTLNKALPGGHSRIAKVSLMVRLIFSLSKFRAPWFLKPAEL